MSISPITGLGLCELRELCERLILSSVWAVLLHKAVGVFTLRLCGKIEVVLDFFEIGWSVIVRSRLFGKLTDQTKSSRAETQGFLQWDSIESSSFAGENCLGGSTSVSTAGILEIT